LQKAVSSFIKLFNRKEDNNQANAHLKTSWQECMIGGTWQTIDAASFINLSSAGDFIHRSSWVKLERSFTLPVRAALWKSSNSVYIGVAVCMLWNNFEDPLIIPGRICSISVGERRIPPSKLQIWLHWCIYNNFQHHQSIHLTSRNLLNGCAFSALNVSNAASTPATSPCQITSWHIQ